MLLLKEGIIMKKIISGVLALTICASMLCGCQEIESSSVPTPMTTTTPLVSGDTSVVSDQASTILSDQSAQSQTSSLSVSSDEASFLNITMKDWDSMNTDAKYINMEAILKYITDSGIKTSLDVVDLVTALDKSGNTSNKKTAYDLALKEINKNNKKSS